MSELLMNAGPAGWVVFGLGALALLLSAVFAGLAAFGFRVPAPLWFFTPFLMLLAGYAGTGWSVRQALDALQSVSGDMASTLAAVGWSEALAPVILAYAVGSACLLVAAWLGAIGHAVKVGLEPEWSVGRAVATLMIPGAVGLFQLVYVVVAYHHGVTALVSVPLMLLLGAPAMSIAIVRVGTDEPAGDAGRIAAARVLVGTSWVGAILWAAIASNLAGEASSYFARAHAAPETMSRLVAVAEVLRGGAWAQGVLAVLLAGIFAASAGLSRSRYIESGRSVVGAVITVVMVLVTLVVHAVVMGSGKPLTEAVPSLDAEQATP